MSDFIALYPLKFAPLYFERIWGGTQMTEVLGRNVPQKAQPIGEAWEIVDRAKEQSVVVNGPLAGRTLGELVRECGIRLLGREGRSYDRFPLLVKVLDAGDRLSLQVHPDSAACRELGGGAEPKTEMWYVIAARKGAKIMAGLSPRATRQQLLAEMSGPEVEKLLQVYTSQPGDAYFITSGTLHAIGAGNLILEIQQNSDTTYRVSDWGRVDAQGKSRELHVEKGLKSINFVNRTSPRVAGVSGSVNHNRKFDVVTTCPYFRICDLRLVEMWNDDTAGQSFHLLSAVRGSCRITWQSDLPTPNGTVELRPGESCLMPACCGRYVITPDGRECAVVRTTL